MYVSDNMAEWLRRQPAKLMGYARVGSNPTVVDSFLLLLLLRLEQKESNSQPKKNRTRNLKKRKGGDARIELATSCTLSKNHTTRPITLVTKNCVRRELNPGPSLGKRRS
jgi:hypothetical protein